MEAVEDDDSSAPAFTVTVAGPERHDGAAPFTYVLNAPDLATAERTARVRHAKDCGLAMDASIGDQQEPDVITSSGRYNTFDGPPPWPADLPARFWNDLRTPGG
jgi:hypothetical protein